MARHKNAPESVRIKQCVAERLRMLRTEFYGERGGPDLARKLGIPVRTWYNYENGVTVPAEIILRIVELTAVEPVWLLRGEGAKFRVPCPSSALTRSSSVLDNLAGSPVTTLLRAALERLEEEERSTPDFSLGAPIVTRRDEEGTIDDDMILLEADGRGALPLTPADGARYDHARSEWLEARQAFRNLQVADDSMAPIVAEGAHVAYAEPEPVSESLHDKLVVAWIDGKPMVRWFQHCGRFALLRAENPAANPPSILVELDRAAESWVFHRVLWISTPH